MNAKILTLPDFTVKSLKELKKWQVDQLLLFSSIHVLPDILQELYCLYMDERFVVMASTIHGAGKGCFSSLTSLLQKTSIFRIQESWPLS